MEVSAFSFRAEKYWTEEKERALIAFFSKHSCLWNHKSESYKNRHLRWQTLEHLRVLLSGHPPPVPFTVEEIKSKFKNLRTTFQRQYKLVKASKSCWSDDVFVPQWKHYQQLMFLQDDCPDDQPPSPPPPDPQEEQRPAATSPELIVSFLPTSSTSSSSSPSCVPSNMMAKCYWTEERERALIAFYSKHDCLWRKKSENHNNRQLRLKLLEALRSQLSDHSVSFSVEDVKSKFKNLRTVFKREFKTVQASRLSDKLYASKWKHYQQLLFLCESCDEDDGPDDLQLLEDKEVERGGQMSSSTLSGFSSSSTQVKFSNPAAPSSDVKTNSGAAAYQIFLPASPDNLKLEIQATSPSFPTSPSTDRKPCRSSSPPHVSGSVQLDGRTSTDSRCHWTEAKVQQLISFYSEHGCLWSSKSESYRNKLLRLSLLETLSDLLSDADDGLFTVDEIKTKFRNLRTIFQREHKAVSANKTCGSEDFYLPKWKHYSELMFLCESCDEDERADDLRFHEPQESGKALSSCYHGNQAAAKANAAPPSPTPPDSQRSSPSSSPSTSSSHADSRVSGGRKRASRRLTPPSSDMLDIMRSLWQSQTPSPHGGFLKYVEECLNETPPDKVKKLKKKIIETIHSASEEL